MQDNPDIEPSKPPANAAAHPKSLEHTSRLRNLLDISVLLTSYESDETTIPKVLEKFSKVLHLRSAICMLGDDAIYTWQAPGVDDAELGEARDAASKNYRFLTNSPNSGADSRFARKGIRVPRAIETPTITLPIVTRHEIPAGLLQLKGYGFDEPDLLYLSTAINQLSLAIFRELRVRSSQVRSEQRLTTAEDARDEATRTRRLQEEIMAIVSHDLKNPLTSILISSELMIEGGGLDKRTEAKARAIRRAAEEMRKLISDLLDWASIDLGKLSVQKAPCPAKDLASEAVDFMSPIIRQKVIRLSTDTGPENPLILCDSRRVLQIFSNLLGNAVKFTPEGGRINLKMTVDDTDVTFAISDSGPGMPAQTLEHVFDRFWQDEATANKGSGLGLAIVKGLVEAHGGRIWADSKPGEGSTFTFTLPRDLPQPGDADA